MTTRPHEHRVYLNTVERNLVVGAFLLMSLLSASGAIAADSSTSRVVVAPIFVAAFLAAALRCRARPALYVGGEMVVVRTVLMTRRIAFVDVDHWDVETRRVGAFPRAVLVAVLRDGGTRSLGADGIWASLRGAGQSQMLDLAAVLNQIETRGL